MKAYLQHDGSGLFYRNHDEWVNDLAQALAFLSSAEAEAFRENQRIDDSHTVWRIDPLLVTRFQVRAPGAYQRGE